MTERPCGTLLTLGCPESVLASFADRPDLDTRLDSLARVVRVERSRTIVVGGDGRDLRVKASVSTVVGDWVVVRQGAILAVLPRQTTLERVDPGRDRTQVLVANVDMVLITAPADRLHLGRVERELALAWQSRAEPFVVFTKFDLAPPVALAELRAHCGGVRVLAVSALSGVGLDELASLLVDRTAVLLGPSGAGKSTLVNALVGRDLLATGTVREGDHRGRHTTSARQLVNLPGGGILIDTPGLRSLELVGPLDEHVFPEIERMATSCRFANCRHRTEPGCAVIAAVATGLLRADRVASYSKLMSAGAPKRRPHRKQPRNGGVSARRSYESSIDVDEERRTR